MQVFDAFINGRTIANLFGVQICAPLYEEICFYNKKLEARLVSDYSPCRFSKDLQIIKLLFPFNIQKKTRRVVP